MRGQKAPSARQCAWTSSLGKCWFEVGTEPPIRARVGDPNIMNQIKGELERNSSQTTRLLFPPPVLRLQFGVMFIDGYCLLNLSTARPSHYSWAQAPSRPASSTHCDRRSSSPPSLCGVERRRRGGSALCAVSFSRASQKIGLVFIIYISTCTLDFSSFYCATRLSHQTNGNIFF